MSKLLTDADLDALAALEAKATPGPWRNNDDPEAMAYAKAHHQGHQIVSDPQACGVASDVDDDDAALIAAARNALPRLLVELRALRAEHVPGEMCPTYLAAKGEWEVETAKITEKLSDVQAQSAIAQQLAATAVAEAERLKAICEAHGYAVAPHAELAAARQHLSDATTLAVQRDERCAELEEENALWRADAQRWCDRYNESPLLRVRVLLQAFVRAERHHRIQMSVRADGHVFFAATSGPGGDRVWSDTTDGATPDQALDRMRGQRGGVRGGAAS